MTQEYNRWPIISAICKGEMDFLLHESQEDKALLIESMKKFKQMVEELEAAKEKNDEEKMIELIRAVDKLDGMLTLKLLEYFMKKGGEAGQKARDIWLKFQQLNKKNDDKKHNKKIH